MEIRFAKDGDLGGLRKLLHQVLEVHHKGRPDLFLGGVTKYSDEEILEILQDEGRPVFVAVEEGEVLGYAFCVFQEARNSRILTPIRTLYLDDLCVDEEKRGQGVGSALYRHVLAFARKEGCYNLTLNVWACNPEAMAFYGAMGLKEQKRGMEAILD